MDRSTGETLDVPLEKLHLHASFFLPWAGVEKVDLETAHYADVKAAEKMARLYDEIRKTNDVTGDEETHALNVFFSRLLFCFFAEDTGIFEPGQVTKAIGSLTQQDGSDLHTFLDQLFEVLDTPVRDRGDLPSYLRDFGYVNGSLFSHRTRVPEFSAKARAIILECSELDWSEINPDIFGSMMQAVVHSDQRAGLGMHYTSVENIMKVLRPLFLDELDEAYAAAEDDARKLHKLHDRISNIKVFDPACGSGNFLVIAYKELRKLEHQILERLRELEADPKGTGLFEESRISLASFYGIEIDDFAHEIAKLSLWLSKHQVNKTFEGLFGSRLQMIPLTEAGHVACANATRADWRIECAASSGDEIYVCGNPPYLGSSMQSREQKEDISSYFGTEAFSPNLDYVSLWLLKGADLARSSGAVVGFVSTNSICQGDHVELLFPKLFSRGAEIKFAHQSFPWTNNAQGRAGVTCVVIGLSERSLDPKWLWSDGRKQLVSNIGPYLRADSRNTIVSRERTSICRLPEMVFGSKPTDGGHLNMTRVERDEMIARVPESARFIHRYFGADEFLNGGERYCLWIEDDESVEARGIAPIAERLELVEKARADPKSSAIAKSFANQPHRFVQRSYREAESILVPLHTSERREYVPFGYLESDVVVSNAASVIYNAEPWLFGVISSRMHMTWMRAICGRLGNQYRYAASLVYNTFPVPDLNDSDKSRLAEAAFGVLGARQQFPDRTLAELYDPDKMPTTLLNAHHALDDVVDRLYSPTGFASDDERLAKLFEMYEELTSKQEKLNA
jgi:hypothetical protein